MLVFSLKPGSTFMIGPEGEVTVTVLDVVGGRVRVGIRAPRTVPVDREQLFLKKQAERRQQKAPRSAEVSVTTRARRLPRRT